MVARGKRGRRRSPRLPGYDYAQAGLYFVTLCTYRRECLFGGVMDGQMLLNVVGRAVEECWRAIPEHFPQVRLDAFVVMPNHVHGIVVITDVGGHPDGANDDSTLRDLPVARKGTSQSLGSIIRGFKIGVTKWVRANRTIAVVWQRNYYEHVIRDETSLSRIREYVIHNPVQWAIDPENPRGTTPAVG
ncbi:MAG: transposase [Chloroflexota bacterium]